MPSNSFLSRRNVIIGGATLAAVATLPVQAFAQTKSEAIALIDKLLLDLNKIINSGKSDTALFKDFEKLFNTYGDVPIIARSALGVAWRSASASQQKRYVKAFSGYMARKWGKRFREFEGGQIVVKGSKKTKRGFLVNSTAILKGQAPFSVDWQVSDRSGKNLMFDLLIEGISLLVTERTEITAMLDARKGNVDTLIRDLGKIK
jgi:phospholipid transport system substrate-binding protein